MSPALSGSSALQRVELGDALEIRDGIIFDFYPGLPHMWLCFCLYVKIFHQQTNLMQQNISNTVLDPFIALLSYMDELI